MRVIPPELTTAVLTALSIGGAWLATFLARRGKREDTRIAESDQSFKQMSDLATARLTEINRLQTALTGSDSERERLRESWEARWDRQMARCRKVTDSLSRAVDALKTKSGADAEREAVSVQRLLEEHNQDDHEGQA